MKCSVYRRNRNRMIVFLVSGLWHGPSWNFIIWGGLHGFYQIIGDITRRSREKYYKKFKIKTDCFSWKLLQIIITFFFVCFAWIFFRAETILQAFGIIRRLFTKINPWVLFDGTLYNLGLSRLEWKILIAALMIMLIVSIIKYKTNNNIDVFLACQNLWFRWLVNIILICTIFIYGMYGPNVTAEQFIYFQF